MPLCTWAPPFFKDRRNDTIVREHRWYSGGSPPLTGSVGSDWCLHAHPVPRSPGFLICAVERMIVHLTEWSRGLNERADGKWYSTENVLSAPALTLIQRTGGTCPPAVSVGAPTQPAPPPRAVDPGGERAVGVAHLGAAN